jgi:hypothetical protein
MKHSSLYLSLTAYEWVIPLLGALIFAGAYLVVARVRRPALTATYLLLIPIPLLAALFAVAEDFVESCPLPLTTITVDNLVRPLRIKLETRHSGVWELMDVLAAFSRILLTLFSGVAFSVPAYLVITRSAFFGAEQAYEPRPVKHAMLGRSSAWYSTLFISLLVTTICFTIPLGMGCFLGSRGETATSLKRELKPGHIAQHDTRGRVAIP